MLNQNKNMKRYTPEMTADRYYTLDTTIDPSQTAIISALNGRVGDDNRAIPLAFVDDGNPHDLTKTSIELRVMDASGVVKNSNDVINLVDPTGGLVIFGVPSEFYEAPGEVQKAYFVLKDRDVKGDDQTISTINITFTVDEAIDITKQQSSIYISAIDKVINETSGVNYAVVDKDNEFTGSNHFTSLAVDNLNNTSLSSLSNSVVSNSVSAEQIQDSLNNLSENVDSFYTSENDKITSVDNRFNSISSQIQTSSGTVITIDSSAITSLSTEISNVSDSLATLSNNIPSQTGDDDNGDYDALSSEVDSISRSMGSMSKAVASISFYYQNDENGVDALSSSIQSQNTSIADIDQKVSSIATVVENESNDVAIARQQANEALNKAGNNTSTDLLTESLTSIQNSLDARLNFNHISAMP